MEEFRMAPNIGAVEVGGAFCLNPIMPSLWVFRAVGIGLMLTGLVGLIVFFSAYQRKIGEITIPWIDLTLWTHRGYQRSARLTIYGLLIVLGYEFVRRRTSKGAVAWDQKLFRTFHRRLKIIFARHSADQSYHLVPVITLVLASFWLYGGFLFRTYTGGDFPPAVSYAMNFKIALDHGQIPPRLVELARELQLGKGSADGTAPTPDAPVFQYYAFLSSALAYPLLSIGIPAPEALGLVIFSMFAVGAIVLYATGIVLGASRAMATVASWSYLASPWLISNIYGRGGVAEGLAHALLPLLALGFAYAWRGRWLASIVAIALGIAALALAHNIFLLFGAFLCALFAAFTFISNLVTKPPRRGVDLATSMAPSLAIAAGVAIGLALTSWLWAPAYLSVGDTIFDAHANQPNVPQTDLSNLSGAWGWPRPYKPMPYFFTIGWWTIPSILAAIILCWDRHGRWRAVSFVTGAMFVCFFALSYWPALIYPNLPNAFGAAQFTFRTLCFLSLLGAMALCLVPWRPSRRTALIAIACMTFSQLGVIFYEMPNYRLTDEQFLKGWEVNAFNSRSPLAEGALRVNERGHLQEANTILVSRLRELTGAPRDAPMILRLAGEPVQGLNNFSIWVADIARPDEKSPALHVGDGAIDHTFFVPVGADSIRVVASELAWVEAAGANVFVRLSRLTLGEAPAESYVDAESVLRVEARGLRRVFAVKPDHIAQFRSTPSGHFVIEIPMVCSRFLMPSQQGKALPHWCDLNYRLNVLISDLSQPIEVVYRTPAWTGWVSFAGFIVLCGVGVGALKEKSTSVL
jgi:hypothetical protein